MANFCGVEVQIWAEYVQHIFHISITKNTSKINLEAFTYQKIFRFKAILVIISLNRLYLCQE